MAESKEPQKKKSKQDYLTGKFIIAMPGMQDPRFDDAIIYICGHDHTGAMGLVINKLIDSISFRSLLDQLEIEVEGTIPNIPIHFGGPVEMGRGFILHSEDYIHESSVKISKDVVLTATLEVLKAMANNKGPKNFLLMLGYSGWSPGQLEKEIQKNGWLEVTGDTDILFNAPLDKKRDRAIEKLGINPAMLSNTSGHA